MMMEHRRHWAMLMETVDVVYPEGHGRANRIIVDVIR
jgi:hypothetical protein